MRSRRDPIVVQFAGQPPSQNITLPRSLAHPLRSTSAASNRAYTNPGQMHVLQQQQLQEQLQLGRANGQSGAPPPRNLLPPQQAPAQYAYAPNPASGPLSQGPSQPMYSANHLQAPYHPSQSPSGQASPRPGVVQNPNMYSNGRPQPPLSAGSQGQPPPMQGVFAQCLAAVGLAGRDADSLSPEEQVSWASQLFPFAQVADSISALS